MRKKGRYHSLYELMDCNTYNLIEKFSVFSGIGIFNLEIFGMESLSFPLSVFLAAISSLLLGNALYMNVNCGILKSKDGIYLEKLYQEFLNEYCQLNDTFSLKNPVEIQTLFYYLLSNGYLSLNQQFCFENPDKCFQWLDGVQVISGQGVCRNVVALFTDILKKLDFSAYQLLVRCDAKEKVIFTREILEDRDSLNAQLADFSPDFILDPLKYQKFLTYLYSNEVPKGENGEVLIYCDSWKKLFMHSNHVITAVFFEDKDYFLDPTQFRFYQRQKRGVLYDSEVDCLIREGGSRAYCYEKGEYLSLKENLEGFKGSISRQEAKKMIDQTKVLCQENKDLFASFYQKNGELYEEISQVVSKVKKRL